MSLFNWLKAEKKLRTVQEVANLYNITEAEIFKSIVEGKLKKYEESGYVFVDQSKVEKLYADRLKPKEDNVITRPEPKMSVGIPQNVITELENYVIVENVLPVQKVQVSNEVKPPEQNKIVTAPVVPDDLIDIVETCNLLEGSQRQVLKFYVGNGYLMKYPNDLFSRAEVNVYNQRLKDPDFKYNLKHLAKVLGIVEGTANHMVKEQNIPVVYRRFGHGYRITFREQDVLHLTAGKSVDVDIDKVIKKINCADVTLKDIVSAVTEKNSELAIALNRSKLNNIADGVIVFQCKEEDFKTIDQERNQLSDVLAEIIDSESALIIKLEIEKSVKKGENFVLPIKNDISSIHNYTTKAIEEDKKWRIEKEEKNIRFKGFLNDVLSGNRMARDRLPPVSSKNNNSPFMKIPSLYNGDYFIEQNGEFLYTGNISIELSVNMGNVIDMCTYDYVPGGIFSNGVKKYIVGDFHVFFMFDVEKLRRLERMTKNSGKEFQYRHVQTPKTIIMLIKLEEAYSMSEDVIIINDQFKNDQSKDKDDDDSGNGTKESPTRTKIETFIKNAFQSGRDKQPLIV